MARIIVIALILLAPSSCYIAFVAPFFHPSEQRTDETLPGTWQCLDDKAILGERYVISKKAGGGYHVQFFITSGKMIPLTAKTYRAEGLDFICVWEENSPAQAPDGSMVSYAFVVNYVIEGDTLTIRLLDEKYYKGTLFKDLKATGFTAKSKFLGAATSIVTNTAAELRQAMGPQGLRQMVTMDDTVKFRYRRMKGLTE